MPALFTTMSTRPNASRAACTIAAPPSAVATLSWFGAASPPAAVISSTTRCAAVAEASAAVHSTTEVVHEYARTPAGQLQRVGAAEAAARSGDDGDSSVETHLRHAPSLSPQMEPTTAAGGVERVG